MKKARTLSRARGLLSVSLFALAPALLAAPGCDAILGIEDLSTPTVLPEGKCSLPTDCPGGGNACFTRDCVGGLCEVSELGVGQPVSSQQDGDCKIVVCNADGTTREDADPGDLPNDSLECTDDACDGVNPTFTAKAAGTACSTGVCDGAGLCVECATTAQCTGGDVCLMSQCVPATCMDGVKNGNETAKDCGGSCTPCEDGRPCLIAQDCKSGVCEGDVCVAAACDDQVRNGKETDVDCGGGDCPTCNHDQKCMDDGDCTSGVCACPGGAPTCMQQVCQVATCSDNVKNGTEQAVDCGPSCLGQCATGDPCEANNWCQSLVCDLNVNKCLQATCSDNVKNGTETGVDCGGMSGGQQCDPCG